MIWIGSRDNAYQQLNDIYTQAGVTIQNYLKFCPNVSKIEKENAEKQAAKPVE